MSSIADERTRGLARLAVRLGANVAPGQDVVVLAFDIEHAGLAREVADVRTSSCGAIPAPACSRTSIPLALATTRCR
jgi:leucyl aminopeptidase (aminopeptidase T)